MSDPLGGLPLPGRAGKAGRAPGALESLVDTASVDDWSVWSVGGLPGGMKPVILEWTLDFVNFTRKI